MTASTNSFRSLIAVSALTGAVMASPPAEADTDTLYNVQLPDPATTVFGDPQAGFFLTPGIFAPTGSTVTTTVTGRMVGINNGPLTVTPIIEEISPINFTYRTFRVDGVISTGAPVVMPWNTDDIVFTNVTTASMYGDGSHTYALMLRPDIQPENPGSNYMELKTDTSSWWDYHLFANPDFFTSNHLPPDSVGKAGFAAIQGVSTLTTPVPEPDPAVMLGAGFAALVLLSRRFPRDQNGVVFRPANEAADRKRKSPDLTAG